MHVICYKNQANTTNTINKYVQRKPGLGELYDYYP